MINEILYRRNSKNEIIFWNIKTTPLDVNTYTISYGTLGKNEIAKSFRASNVASEIKSKIKEKKNIGYKRIESLYDNSPSESSFKDTNDKINYLDNYLPKYNTTADNKLIPMLCKTLKDNKPFEHNHMYFGQPKINGLRCTVRCEKVTNDLFHSYRYTFTSREGNEFTNIKLHDLFDKLIPQKLKELLIDLDGALDGELYIPNTPVNIINSYAKSDVVNYNSEVQFWCYDICIEGYDALSRQHILYEYLNNNIVDFKDKTEHFNNRRKLILLSNVSVSNITEAISYRDKFIDLGFEGLVIRDCTKDYGFGGGRSNRMLKFKKIEDGYFEIVNIIPEGKRVELPKFVCKNDINDELFECTINLPQNVQKEYLINYGKYLGKKMLVEYRERSGVKMVPFHAKGIKVIMD